MGRETKGRNKIGKEKERERKRKKENEKKEKEKGSSLEGMGRWHVARRELSAEGKGLAGGRQKQTQMPGWFFLCAPLSEVGTGEPHKEQIVSLFILSPLDSSSRLKGTRVRSTTSSIFFPQASSRIQRPQFKAF